MARGFGVAAGDFRARAPRGVPFRDASDGRDHDRRSVLRLAGDEHHGRANLSDLETKPPVTSTMQCDNGRIGALVIVPSGANDDEVAVRVVSGETMDPDSCVSHGYPQGCIVARRALRFIPHADLNVGVFMANACNGVACGPEETCIEGTCRSAVIADPSACEMHCDEGILVPGGAPDAGIDATISDAPISGHEPPCPAGERRGDRHHRHAARRRRPPPVC